jgi:pyrroline-5-carboxylate reductase
MPAPVLLVGAGRMGTALLRGWAKKKIPVVAVEPKPQSDLRKLKGVSIVRTLDETKGKFRACVIALKPQVLRGEVAGLKPVSDSGALMISIAAGTTVRLMKRAWGARARVVRAMPNTPGAIGRGMSALFASPNTTANDRTLAESLLAALGETLWVKKESMIDAVTAVSGSGPAYVFLLVETLAAAAEAEGLPRGTAIRLARATVSGSGALLDADPAPAGELRRHVTSPHGTTEAALKVLMAKNGLENLMKRAVSAARNRAEELGA